MSVVNLSLLPAPDVVDPLSWQTIVDEMVAALELADPDLFESLAPGDPVYELIGIFAYRELNIRARINDAAKAVMLPSAWGTNLDNIGAFFDRPRLTLIEEDLEASPPIEEVKESDDPYRLAIHETPRALGTGTRARYERAALEADARISSVYAATPNPAELDIEWAPDPGTDPGDYTEIGQNILDAINGTDADGFEIRLLTDQVSESIASASPYDVTAHLHLRPGPDPAEVIANAQAAVEQLTVDLRGVRVPVPLSALYDALQQVGVEKVDLTSPGADLASTAGTYHEVGTITITSETAAWLL